MTRSQSPWVRILLAVGMVAGLAMGCRVDQQRPLFVISGPSGLQSFQIAEEEGEVLWSIAASEPTTLSRIYYGVVPDGFRQVTPPDSEPPRALWPGEWLQTETVGVEGTFYHEGVASGPRSFAAMNSRMVLKRPDSRALD